LTSARKKATELSPYSAVIVPPVFALSANFE
jgi:hypothetical protein